MLACRNGDAYRPGVPNQVLIFTDGRNESDAKTVSPAQLAGGRGELFEANGIETPGDLFFGTDQVSGDDRGFDFLASRWWCHRKLWETAYVGESPIADPDVTHGPPMLRGLALPDEVLPRVFHERLLARP